MNAGGNACARPLRVLSLWKMFLHGIQGPARGIVRSELGQVAGGLPAATSIKRNYRHLGQPGLHANSS